MSGKKLRADQHAALLQALPDVIETLNGGGTVTKFHASVLTEIWVKMSKQSLEMKPEYNLKLSKPQKLAFVLAVELGLFQEQGNYLETTTGMLMLEYHPETV